MRTLLGLSLIVSLQKAEFVETYLTTKEKSVIIHLAEMQKIGRLFCRFGTGIALTLNTKCCYSTRLHEKHLVTTLFNQ